MSLLNHMVVLTILVSFTQISNAASSCADFSGAWTGTCTLSGMDFKPETSVESMTATQAKDCSSFSFEYATHTMVIVPGDDNPFWKPIYSADGKMGYMGKKGSLTADGKVREESNELDGAKVLETEYEILPDGTLRSMFRLFLANNSGIQGQIECLYKRR